MYGNLSLGRRIRRRREREPGSKPDDARRAGISVVRVRDSLRPYRCVAGIPRTLTPPTKPNNRLGFLLSLCPRWLPFAFRRFVSIAWRYDRESGRPVENILFICTRFVGSQSRTIIRKRSPQPQSCRTRPKCLASFDLFSSWVNRFLLGFHRSLLYIQFTRWVLGWFHDCGQGAFLANLQGSEIGPLIPPHWHQRSIKIKYRQKYPYHLANYT